MTISRLAITPLSEVCLKLPLYVIKEIILIYWPILILLLFPTFTFGILLAASNRYAIPNISPYGSFVMKLCFQTFQQLNYHLK